MLRDFGNLVVKELKELIRDPRALDFNFLPIWLRAVLFAIPYSHPVLASKAVTMDDYRTVVWGIVYVSLFTIGIMYAASRLFATEKILTAKLGFKGLGKPGKTQTEE